MKKTILASIIALTSLTATAETYDLTKTQQIYSEETGWGYEYNGPQDLKSKKPAPFYFAARVADGNYRVTVTLGSKKRAAVTSVRAEGRRLMVERCATAKGKTQQFTFNVHVHSNRIDEKTTVGKTDPKQPSWDNKLTLEFNGDAPAVQQVQIEPVAEGMPTLYLCGNSTVVDQGREPWASWGQIFPRWFDDQVTVANYAESGLTAASFMATRRLAKIAAQLKEGDYVFCEFGHNDEKEKGPGTGAWYHYTVNLKKFIDIVREKKANIIFLTPTQRRAFEKGNKTLRNTHGDFPAAMRAVAERENVPLIDLHAETKVLFETMGFEGSKQLLVHYPMGTFPWQIRKFEDNTHFNPFGAYEVSKLVVMGLKKINSPLVQHLRADWQDFSPAAPDAQSALYWPESIFNDNRKPDGN